MEDKWLAWAKQLQSIAQAGLTYSKDPYDLERFQQIRDMSVEIMSGHTGTEMKLIEELFANETGYATPKVDIRAVIIKDDHILMVREKMDGRWALPGGWADIGLSPTEVAVKEAKEESGFEVRAIRLLAVHDKKFHPHPPSPYHVYKLFIQCEIIGGQATIGAETSEVKFFSENDLPEELSIERNTESQIRMAFRLSREKEQVECD
ncbi:ADP-ribose pyrophosphatase [Paenibacillus sp. 79R4]|uniref:NUDIX hydrolase n=1 Tax=Paenibacillus sp. 79R4 TaxID=2212847 RepID=UPI0015BD7123|nr:NUDIX hydrolase [Paenibacillus sp. 79R4]NWL88111.1 ADP-ribose pyrophosphatase [Paenibacillus sp. 79R4]